MPTDPTPTAADFEAARIALYGSGPADWHDPVTHVDHVARALATAREAGQDVEVGRRRRLIDRARAEADAAGYARGREESAERIAVLESLLQEARATLARVQAALEAHPIAAAEARGRAEGLREGGPVVAAVRALYLLPEGAWPEWACGECGNAYPRDIIVACPTCSKAARAALASPPTPEPMPPDDIAEQWEDCTGLPDCPGCRVRHPDAPGMCGGFAADTPPTPEPTPSRRALPEQREWVAVGDVVTPANVGVLPVGTRVEQDLGYSETWVATLESPGSWLSGDGGRFADWDVPSADPKRPCTIAYLPPGERDGVRVPGEVDG